jgi:hypothetical protein
MVATTTVARAHFSRHYFGFFHRNRAPHSPISTLAQGPGLPAQKPSTLSAVVAIAPSRRYISTSKSSGNIAISSNSTFGSDNGIEANFFSNLNQSHYKIQIVHKNMNWSTYFALRGTRRLYERVFMVPSALGGFFVGGYWFAQQEFDPTMSTFGMDQLLVYGLGTLASGVLGFALGPVIGSVIFRAAHANARPFLDKVNELRERIRRFSLAPISNGSLERYVDFLLPFPSNDKWTLRIVIPCLFIPSPIPMTLITIKGAIHSQDLY